MENKVLLLDPLCPHRSFKRGTEGLIGAALMGGTGLLSGGIGALSASSNNRAALAFNKWSQLQAQQYNTQMYERQLADQEALYNKYQSPQAIAEQLAKAGINPSALAAKSGFNGGSMPSVPSAGSASPLSAPALENSGAYIGQGIEQMSRVVSNLADSQMKQRQTAKILAEIKGQEIANAHADFSNYLLQKYGENEKVAQLNDLIASAALKDAQKDFEGANTDLTKAIKMIKDKELNIKDEEYSQLLYKGSRLVQLYDDQHNLNLEQQKTERSKQSSNYAVASNQREQAKTENTLRTERESALKLLNRVRAVDAEKSESTKEQAIVSLLADYARNSAVSAADSAEARRRLAILNNIEDHTSGEFMRTLDGSLEWLKGKIPPLISTK